MQTIDIMRRGCKWRLGDGNTVHIWQDSWVLDDNIDRLVTPPSPGFEHARVVILMDLQRRQWDEEVIRQPLLPCEAEMVLRMPFPLLSGPDNVYWKEFPSGQFDVNSAYALVVRLANVSDGNPSSNSPPGFWKKMWKWRLPRKIKLFVWRLYGDSWPTGKNMCIRGMKVHENEGYCNYLHHFICSKDLLEYEVSAFNQQELFVWVTCLCDVWCQRNATQRGVDIRQPHEVVDFAR
ncbi:hypothetical protein LIER_00055 [Lithospermum erythrorhizon]|uniref:Reverse transcriptase zinc-binding domain-containing protein n=1 Tax=Lithospermum erythrorhizon TaxID=34254 RepID=A0AAV3NH49_LITER